MASGGRGAPQRRGPHALLRFQGDQRRAALPHRLSTVAGFIAAAAIGLLVLQVVQSLPAALLAVLLTSGGAAFLNFAQTGSSYVPGLACVSLGLWLGAGARPRSLLRPLCAGFVLALGELLWLPYVLVVPAVLLAIIFLAEGESTVRVRGALLATGACALRASWRTVPQHRHRASPPLQSSPTGWGAVPTASRDRV